MKLVVYMIVLAVGLKAASTRAQPEVRSVVTAHANAYDVQRVGEARWVATDGGIAVFDDSRLREVLTLGLPGTRVRSVSPIGDSIWVGTVEGTARLERREGRWTVTRSLAPRRVRRAVSFGGSVYLGSFGGGLHRVRGERSEPVTLGHPHAYQRISDLLVVGDELWIATFGAGIVRLNVRGERIGQLRRAQGLANSMVWRLHLDGESVVATTANGVSVFRSDGRPLRNDAWVRGARRLPVRDIRAVARTERGLLFGTYGRGVWRTPLSGGPPRRIGRVQRVHQLLAAGSEVWAAHDEGIASIHNSDVRTLQVGGLPSADVTSMQRAFGHLWVGTFGGGLARHRTGTFESVRAAHRRWGMDERINDLAFGAGRLWIATDRGLWWHDGRIFSRVEDPQGPGFGHVTSLHVHRGTVWATASRSLARYRNGRWRSFTGDSTFPVMNLHAVTTDAAGRVWVGSLHGLYRLEPGRNRFHRYTVSSGHLPVDWVTALVPWEGGVMVGTYHGGLSLCRPNRCRIIREGEGGLPSGWVNPHAIARVGAEAWVGTLERGLMIGRPGRWQHITTREGLPSDDVTDVLADSSGVWVATRGGLARFAR